MLTSPFSSAEAVNVLSGYCSSELLQNGIYILNHISAVNIVREYLVYFLINLSDKDIILCGYLT